MFVEQTAERSKTFEANLEADIGNRQSACGEQLLGFFDAPLSQVLMRSLVKNPAEKPQEVISGEAGLAGNLLKIEREVVALIDESPCADEPLIGLDRKHFPRFELTLLLHLNSIDVFLVSRKYFISA